MRRFLSVSSVAVLLVGASAPTAVFAQPDDHRVETRRAEARYSRHHYDNCKRSRQSSATKGTVAGALIGGASGALIGGNALGALVGAGVGAVGGHEIAKSRVHC